ncbi:hypothetical protein EGW08_019718, partial [Elysia chlorotica]
GNQSKGDIAPYEEERDTWSKKIDFLLSVVGFSVDLANVWRFPYLCYKNGGGAFLIPYTMMLLLGGIPLFYMELALGQFNKTGAITCWGAICPLFKGNSRTIVYHDYYHYYLHNLHNIVMIISRPSHLTSSSGANASLAMSYLLPGGTSQPAVSGPGALVSYQVPVVHLNLTAANATNLTTNVFKGKVSSSAVEYFEMGMLGLHNSNGFMDLGQLRWELVACLAGVFIICYFSMWKGILVSGKVVWFTALFPYVVLFILMIRGATLPGAGEGVKYYLTPNFTRLASSQVWVDAANQVFFSLGPGFGVLLAFASYNPIHNNVYRDALMTSVINCATSFFSGFIIFMILGYMADRTGQPIEEVATEGTLYAHTPRLWRSLSPFNAVIFPPQFGGSEAIITALSDEFPVLRRHREIFVGCLFSLYFLVGLAFVSEGGFYLIRLMENFGAGYSMLFAVLFETLAVSWCYGVDKFSADIEAMIGRKPGHYWHICWKFVAPIFIMFIIVFGLANYAPMEHDGYTYPMYANIIGWAIALSSILCIPGFAIFSILRAKGSLSDRIYHLIQPTNNREEKIRRALNTVRLNGDVSGAVGV